MRIWVALLSCIIGILGTLGANAQDLVWAKQFGGDAENIGYAIALDSADNVYTIGEFLGAVDFDPGLGTYSLQSRGNADVFVSKLDSMGNFVWAKQLGGSNQLAGYGVAVDNAGNVYTTGWFSGTVDFDPGPGTYNLTSAGSGQPGDVFVSKLDTNGNFVWAKQISAYSAYGASGRGIAVDSGGNVYTTGFFVGTADFDPGVGTYNLTSVHDYDIFVWKLGGDGNFIWAKQLGGYSDERGYGIAVDSGGNVYTTGLFQETSDFDPGPGTYNLTSAGGWDVFVSKLDTNGNFVWAKQLGGSSNDTGLGVAVGADGDVCTTGWFSGPADFDPGPETYSLVSAGNSDAFVSKLDPDGNFVWAKQFGGPTSGGDPEAESGAAVAVDNAGNVYTTGLFYYAADFDPGPGTHTLTSAGQKDAFVSKLDSAGNFVWAEQLGGSSYDMGQGIAVDNAGNVYTTGGFWLTADFDPGPGTYNLTSLGEWDVFVSKLSPSTVDHDGDLFSPATGDCDDADSHVYPGGPELCDGKNNNCSDPTWPTVPANEIDHDGDHYVACQPWVGSDPRVSGGGDCDDGNTHVYPGAPELCDGIDNQCPGNPGYGQADEGPPACSDGNVCTQTDTCVAGTCVGSNLKTCSTLDQCHLAGVCDAATGVCSNPPKPDGTPCDDRSVCTTNDMCAAGVCSGQSVTKSDECRIAAISLTMTARPMTYSAPGNRITYTYVIQNVGGVTVNGPFSVTDDRLGVIPCGVSPLAPNERTRCSVPYTIIPDDVTMGTLTSHAEASNGTVFSNVPSLTVTGVSQVIRYSSLGDSYSSGQGLGPPFGPDYLPGTATPANECHRSHSAYPFKITFPGVVSPDEEFIACSRAVTKNVLPAGDPYYGQGQYNEPPQLDHTYDAEPHPTIVNTQTQMVTLTIGGNDARFADLIEVCAVCGRFLESGCDSWLCRPWLPHDLRSPREAVSAWIAAMKPRAEAVYQRIIVQAPYAAVFVLGYPRAFSEDSSCLDPEAAGFGYGGRVFLNRVAADLNAAIRSAAAGKGVHFVDIARHFAGHERCAVNAYVMGDIWLRGWTVPFDASFHPNPKGHSEYASALDGYIWSKVADESWPLLPSGLPANPEPQPPTDAASTTDTAMPSLGQLFVEAAADPACCGGNTFAAGQNVRVRGGGFGAGASIIIRLLASEGSYHSDFDSATADAEGALDYISTLPADAPGRGEASLQALGLRSDGGALLLMSDIGLVASVLSDTDGDGIPDRCDNCLGVSNLEQLDSDHDGTGDECDPCPNDSANDADGDGLCADADPCPWDRTNDADGDGRCESEDDCRTVWNPDQLDSDHDGVGDACDNCPLVFNPDQANADSDPVGDVGDCEPNDPTVYPGGPEVNDGKDNQCPGEPGYGVVDEIDDSGAVTVSSGTYTWRAQPGAVLYEIARSTRPDFSFSCTLFIATTPSFTDNDNPDVGAAFFYLLRAATPHRGSWGQTSTRVERMTACQ